MRSFMRKNLDHIGVLMGAVILVGMGFMAQRMLVWDRPCLKFSGVISLHVDGFEGGVTSCQSTSRFKNAQLDRRIKSYLDDINELRRVQTVLPDQLRGVFVTVTDKDPFFLLFSERSLIVGSEIAQNKKAFQKVILSAVAFQSFSGFESLGKELRADLLWYLFAGDEEWTDPTLGVSVDPKKWLKIAGTPRTVGEYCSSPMRQIYDLSFCRFELDKKQELLPRKRFQPLISWTLFKTLQNQGIFETSAYLRHLFAQDIKRKSDLEEDLSAEGFVRQEVKDLLVSHSEAEVDSEISDIWSAFHITSPGEFDFVVEVDEPHLLDAVVNSLTQWQKNSLIGHGSKILVVYGEDQLELPLAQRVSYSLEDVSSQTHLVLGCRLPQIRTVASLSADNLIALRVCDASQLPHWADILREGKSNKTASFRLELHVPSLKRWSRHQPQVLAENKSIDRVFCERGIAAGYPFSVSHCP